MKKRKLLVVMSHSLTKSQEIDAFENLSVTETITMPEHIARIWSEIPPDFSSISERVQPIIDWVLKTANGNDFVLVQGDFGATYLVVKRSLEKGLTPIYATTRRVVSEESHNEEIVVMQRQFEHVRFRQYEGG
jgi:hypothetical protein